MINLYNKEEFINKLLEEHEKGYSNFYSVIEIGKATHGKEFNNAIWKYLNTNIEFSESTESISMIESALHPYIVKKLNEKNKQK